jgi:hypothetical protein
LLIQDGVTTIGGFTVQNVRGITDGFSSSPSGQYVMVRVVLAGSGDAVVLISFARCGTADFDCDGDVGTDADIEAFFACLGGNCPALPCNSTADFDADGDVGTDADIEAFFRVLSGGNC